MAKQKKEKQPEQEAPLQPEQFIAEPSYLRIGDVEAKSSIPVDILAQIMIGLISNKAVKTYLDVFKFQQKLKQNSYTG